MRPVVEAATGGERTSARRPRARRAVPPNAADALRRTCRLDGGLPEAIDGAVLETCAALGFAAVIVSAHAAETASDEALADFAARCRPLGLSALADVELDRRPASDPSLAAHPHLYAPVAADAPPDPRFDGPQQRHLRMRFELSAAADTLAAHAAAVLDRLADAGLAGFRCLAPQRVPAAVWRQLIGERPALAFAAWTPGLDPDQVAQLENAGWAAVYASLPWWDFRAGWWLDEDARLRRVAPVCVPLTDPDAAGPEPEGERAECRLRQRLAFAAAGADGLLVAWRSLAAARPGARLGAAVADANVAIAARARRAPARPRDLIGAGAPVLAWLLEPVARGTAADAPVLLLNPDPDRVVTVAAAPLLRNAGGAARLVPAAAASGETLTAESTLVLEPGEVRLLSARADPPVTVPTGPDEVTIGAAARAPRIIIESPSPCVEGGRFAVKRCVGDRVEVEADVFADGHDAIAVELLWKAADARSWNRTRMRALGNDRWAGAFALSRVGRHVYTVRAWRDGFATLRADLEKRRLAGTLTPLDVEEACGAVADAAAHARGAIAAELRGHAERLAAADAASRVELLLDVALCAAMDVGAERRFMAELGLRIPVDADPVAARYASWYELFPRSQGAGPDHGTFDDVVRRLPAIRAMGFDVLYLPPIHPIGHSQRKGRNNAARAEPGDPGSPYAIGSEHGGHDAVHPELGGLSGFRRLRAAAAAQGIEIALDLAVQCSPDHPWLREHPEWFAWRADGSVRHAENPPKRYEDIVNVDFHAPGAVPALWQTLRDLVLYWIGEGVRTFRVDNPHTKPFAFWEWLIADVRARHPDTIFLSEAFTRPKPMYRLARLGFSQSYTYFTWRNTKAELTAYFEELAHGAPRDFLRPHLFANTPDINPTFLQHGGRAGFLIRAALAATLSGLWGIYSGFELCEAAAVPGREEYLDSEKYQLRHRDWNAPGHIVAEIARLNAIRRANPALQDHLGLAFHNAFNDRVLVFGKTTPGRENAVLVAVSLDPHAPQEADFEVPLWEWGLPDDAAMLAEDLVGGTGTVWRGKRQHLRLTPERPYAIWRIRPEEPTWT